MKREGKHILETVERYAPPSYDYLTDDMTVPFAIALAEKDKEIERLRAALSHFVRAYHANDKQWMEAAYKGARAIVDQQETVDTK